MRSGTACLPSSPYRHLSAPIRIRTLLLPPPSAYSLPSIRAPTPSLSHCLDTNLRSKPVSKFAEDSSHLITMPKCTDKRIQQGPSKHWYMGPIRVPYPSQQGYIGYMWASPYGHAHIGPIWVPHSQQSRVYRLCSM